MICVPRIDTAMGVHINAMDNHGNEIVQAFKEWVYLFLLEAFVAY